MSSFQETFKAILVRDHLITPQALQKVFEEQQVHGGELTKILLKQNLLTEDQLTNILSEALGLPLINVAHLKLDPKVVRKIPQEIALKYKVLPISQIGDQLTLAMADPLDLMAIDNVQALTGLAVTPTVARAKDIVQTVERYYSPEAGKTLEKIIQDIKEQESEDLELVKDAPKAMEKAEIESLTQEAPIIKLANTILQQAVNAKASDVFIEPMEKALRIRYRVDGMLREIDQMSKVLHFPLVSRIKVISSLDISEHRLPQDGRFKTIIDGEKEIDFRISILPTAQGEKVVMRILDKNLEMVDIMKLGFEETSLKRLQESCLRPHGMILACGPTGSGKTTTLYAILKYIDSPGKNIITVEDPVEYQVKGFNQVNIRPDLGLTFPASLRSILRQDPDIIMVGEIRDSETLDIAIKAALTGHLVLSSLHTTTAPGSLTRMINMGVEPFLICSSVVCIVAQRLVRRICPKCKESYALIKTVYDKLNIKRVVPNKDLEFFRGKGCAHCFNSGYSGRIGITEVLALTHGIKDLILGRASEQEIKAAARREGMLTMREDGLLKACAGLTTLEEVVRVTAPDEDVPA